MSSTTLKTGGSNPPPRNGGHGAAYDPYYGDMLDAIQFGSVEEAIHLFSRKGYDVNTEIEYVFDDGKKYNVTPLYWAVRYRKPKLCKYLLDHGARSFNNLVFEYFPLHEACSRGYSDVLRVFIDSKIDLNKATPDGDTPLHIASMRGHVECVHLLLNAGANSTLCNKAGRTPVQEALYQHQDDLIQLFQVYPNPSQDSSQDKPVGNKIRRRLSLGSHRPPLRQQESSPASIPCRRPKSFYGDPANNGNEPAGGGRTNSQQFLSAIATSSAFVSATTRSRSHQDLAVSTAHLPPHSSGVGIPSTAPSSSDHVHAPAKIVTSSSSSSYSSYSSKPTPVTQLSIASPCAADSPSPVERDGVGRTLLNESVATHSKHSSGGGCSLPVTTGCSSSNAESTSNNSRMSLSSPPNKHVTKLTDTHFPATNSSNSQLYGTSFTSLSGGKVETTPTVYIDSGRPHPRHTPQLQQSVPHHFPLTSTGGSLSVLRHHQSKLHYRLMGSVSNPEFPNIPEVMVSAEKRAQSFINLYDRAIKVSIAPIEAQSITPFRERLNTLSRHVYSSFDESNSQQKTSLGSMSLCSSSLKTLSNSDGARGEPVVGCVTAAQSHPVYTVVDKMLHEMGQKLKLSTADMKSVIDSVYISDSSLSPEHSGTSQSQNKLSSSSHVIVPKSLEAVECAESVLKEYDVDVDEKPFDVKFGVPSSGYMTLQYRASRKKSSTQRSGGNQLTGDLLKVVVRVFNLKNWAESSQYHSQSSAAAATSTTIATSTSGLPSSFGSSFEHLSLARPLQEVAILQKLSSSPHPNVARMIHHFRAPTSDQYHMLARTFESDNPQAIYTAGHTSDFLLLQQCSVLTLSKHFENLRMKHFGVVPETDVLVTVSQLNLGIAHLVKNHITHCSINPNSVYIDENDANRLLLANFSQSVEFSEDFSSIRDIQSRLRSKFQSKSCQLSLCPEVAQWLLETETDYCYVQHNMRTLFATNDSYAAGRMIYSLLLGEPHEALQQIDTTARQQLDYCSSITPLPQISHLSPQCNYLLQKLVSPNISERLRPIEAAVASLVLLFGPRPSRVRSLEECHQWLLAETMQFYMRPALPDSVDSDTIDIYKMLLCIYLSVANVAPCLVWKCCSFFKHLPA